MGSGSTPLPWPPALVGTPAIAVIDRALARDRLGHSLLLHGDSLETLTGVAYGIADRLLNPAVDPAAGRVGSAPKASLPSTTRFAPEQHPDCFVLRPAKKMRQISAEATRELIAKVQVTASVGARKVAIIHEADRMHPTAANVFLKTLEEPPANTTLLLLTTHPYALLPTILSRCLPFRFPADSAAELAAHEEGWASWLNDYRAWLGRLSEAVTEKRAVADHVFSIYGLISRFGLILENATTAAWTVQKASLPAELEEDEEVAIESGIANGLRTRFFASIEEATRTFARERLDRGEDSARRAFASAIEKLEDTTRLLRLNLNSNAALETFLLTSLRLWSGR